MTEQNTGIYHRLLEAKETVAALFAMVASGLGFPVSEDTEMETGRRHEKVIKPNPPNTFRDWRGVRMLTPDTH